MLTTAILASLLWTANAEKLVVPPVSTKFADLFEPREYRYTGGQYRRELFKYRLFVPHRLKSDERLPLLVWLHGGNEVGSNNTHNLTWLHLILKDRDKLEQYRFFILAVQSPDSTEWFQDWAGHRSKANPADDMLTVTYEIMKKTLREQPVDPDRVYLAGVSSGGTACWEMALRYPEAFAAVVPLAAAGGDPARAADIKGIPVWAFHNRRDGGVPPCDDEDMVEAVNAAGGDAFLTIEEASGHDCWSAAFRKYDAMGWMLSQRRGEPCSNPRGGSSHAKWYLFAITGIIGIAVSLHWYVRYRRAF